MNRGHTKEATQARVTAAKRARWWRPVVLLALVLAAVVAARSLGLGDRLAALRDWIEGLGALGPVVFIALYAAATVVAIPGSPLTVAAGVLFGSLWGVVIVSIAATLGASGAFLVARYVARDATEASLSRNPRFQRLYSLTETHGAVIVAITRLIPLFPFNLINYGFGLTRVRFGTYVFWSWLCMLPGTVLYVVGADAVARAIARSEIPWVLIGILAGALAVLAVAGHAARRILRKRELREGRGQTAGETDKREGSQ